MSFAPVPLDPQEAGPVNSMFRPIPVSGVDGDGGAVAWDDITDVPAVLDDIPEPPSEGTFVLTATDGVLSWETA